jgi:segregation and condensation protein A
MDSTTGDSTGTAAAAPAPTLFEVADEFSRFFRLRLEQFDGPIDLLLHLVKQNELSIEKISLAQVAQQYFLCIKDAAYIDLELAGEYLLMAATLLSIKSSVLLNQPVELVEDEEGNLVDPHEELLRRLREAQVYKEGALKLGGRALLGVDVFAASGSLESVEPPPLRLKQHDPLLLGIAFKKLLERAGEEQTFTITIDSVSIVERMMELMNRLSAAGGRIAFGVLLGDVRSRGQLIGSFVAMLELCKRRAIVVMQFEIFGEIEILAAGQEIQSGAELYVGVEELRQGIAQ